MRSKILIPLLCAMLGFGAMSARTEEPAAKEADAPADHQGSRQLVKQADDGTVVLHAKDASVHGSTVRYEPDPHKNTVGYWTRLEDWVSWEFEIKKDGKFSVEILQG